MRPHVRSGRPSAHEAQARRDEFARLVAEDMRQGGLDQAARNVVHNCRSVRLHPERALRLSYEPEFVAQVEKLVGFKTS